MTRRAHNNSPLSLFAFQDIITSVTGVFLLMILLIAVELVSRHSMQQPNVAVAEVDRLTASIEELEDDVKQLRETIAATINHALPVSEFTQSSADSAVQVIREKLKMLNEKIEARQTEHAVVEEQQTNANAEFRDRTPDLDRLGELRELRTKLKNEVAELKDSQRVFYNANDERGRQVFLVELFDNAILVTEVGKTTLPLRFSGTELESGLSNSNGDRGFLDWARQQPKLKVRFVIIIHPGTTKRFQEIRSDLRKHGFAIGFDLLPRDKIAIDVKGGVR